MSASDDVALWGALVKHPAWKMLEEMCDGHVSTVAGQVLIPALSTEDTLRKNVNCGEIMGVHYVLGLPGTMLEQAQRQVNEERKLESDDESPVDESNVP